MAPIQVTVVTIIVDIIINLRESSMFKKTIFTLVTFIFIVSLSAEEGHKHDKHTSAHIYSVGCGSCIYDVKGAKGYPGYIKVKGKAIPLTGLKVSFHKLGLCGKEGKAKVAGKVVDGKFVATSFELVKNKTKGDDHKDHKH